MWIVVGVLLGILAALRRGKIVDRTIVSGALLFYSFPSFFIGLLLLQVIVFQLNVMQTPGYVSPTANFGSFLYNLFLPALTLALIYAAAYIRITRTYMLETMGEDYLRTAKAKGLQERAHHLQAHPACGADAHRHPRRPRPRWAARRCADH